MVCKRIRLTPWLVLVVLLAAGCGTATPGADIHTSPLVATSLSVAVSPLATATLAPTSTPLPTPTPLPTSTPTPMPTPALSPIQLVVLHTNDNWGETEPCG